MPYWEMLLNCKNGNRIFEERSLGNLKIEGYVFIVVSKLFSPMRIYIATSARSTLEDCKLFCWSTVLLKKHKKKFFYLRWAHTRHINNEKKKKICSCSGVLGQYILKFSSWKICCKYGFLDVSFCFVVWKGKEETQPFIDFFFNNTTF